MRTYTRSRAMTTTLKLLSFEDYLSFDDGTDNKYELVCGQICTVPPPTGQQYLMTKFLEQAIDTEIERLSLPWMALKGAGVRTGVSTSRLPDLCLMTVEQFEEIFDRPAVLQTPALLTVEVVSPSTSVTDYRQKRSEYAALGIPEYWLVDALESKVSVLQLDEGLYEVSEFQGSDQISSVTLPELNLTAAQILAAKI